MSNYINKAIFIENMKMFFLIPVVFIAVFLIFLVMPLHTDSNLYGVAYEANEILNGRNIIYVVSMFLFPLLMAIFINGFNFNKAWANAYNSFPVNRRIIFLTNYSSGILLIIASLVIVSLFLLIPFDYLWGAPVHSPFRVFVFFIRSVIVFSFYYSIFTLTMTLSGNSLVGILFSAALNVLPISINILILLVSEIFILGHPGTHGPNMAILISTIPLVYSNRLGLNFITIAYIVQTIAFIAFAYFANKKRKAEKASSGVVFEWLENICIFMFSLFGAVITPLAFVLLFRNVVAFHLGIFTGYIIFFLLGQIILERSFVIKQRLKLKIILPNILILILVYVVINFSNFFFAFYVQRIPNASNIESVDVHLFGHHSSLFLSHRNEEIRDIRAITDGETIELVRELHRDILRNRDIRFSSLYELFVERRGDDTFVTTISYTLTNGRTVTRMYEIFEDSIPDDFAYELLSDDSFILRDFILLMEEFESDITNLIIHLDRMERGPHGWWSTEMIEFLSIYYDNPNIEDILSELRSATLKDMRNRIRNENEEQKYSLFIVIYSEYHWQTTIINIDIENAYDFINLLDFEYFR